MLFFTSDTHFFHKRMLEFRPFDSVEEMNERLVDKWNTTVTDKDEIWHLGDVSFGNWEKTSQILARLNGRKHLVLGNHDKQFKNRLPEFFQSVQDYRELKYQDAFFVLMHYPLLRWDRGHYGTIHLHGHCHGNLPLENIRRFDVGVDAVGFVPISADQILTAAQTREIAEYHH